MNAVGVLLVRWLIHAVVVMGAVALVSPKNPRNTLPRALFVTLIVALAVTPLPSSGSSSSPASSR